MSRRGWWAILLMCLVLGAPTGRARADEPGPTPSTHHGRTKKKKPRAPRVSTSCTKDEDCAFSAIADGQCCPSLCQPRAVSKASAEALEKYAAACAPPEGGCPVMDCAPPRVATEPACINRKCAARAQSPQMRE